jgi:hypothetical protein
MENPAWPAWLAADRQRGSRQSPTRSVPIAGEVGAGNSHLSVDRRGDKRRSSTRSPAIVRGNSHLPIVGEVERRSLERSTSIAGEVWHSGATMAHVDHRTAAVR